MALLSSILGRLSTFTGSNQNDKMTVDVRGLHGTTSSNFSSLDGGKGFDTLTIQLTESQHTAMKAEMKAKMGTTFNGRLDLGELVTLFKVFTGQQYVKVDALDLQLKGWESVKLEVSADPVVTPAPPALTYIDEYGRGNFLDAGKSIDLDLSAATLEFEEDTQSAVVTKADEVAYFTGGTAVDFSFAPHTYIGSNLSDRMVGNANSNIFSGEGGNDFLYGNAGNDELRGEGGDDHLDGGIGNDWVVGGEGNDTVNGGTGDDTVTGGAGDDKLYGDDGDDIIDGGAGNDDIYGGNGGDTITGGDGYDLIIAGAGDNVIDGGTGNDNVQGNTGIDTITGGAGQDQLFGGVGDDIIDGGTGNDIVHGGADNDILRGDAGSDTITGGTGNDVMYAGFGDAMKDTFVFTAADLGSADVIHEFVSGQDKFQIDLFGILGGIGLDASSGTHTDVSVTGEFDNVAGPETLTFTVHTTGLTDTDFVFV